jgi:hypothetical protein
LLFIGPPYEILNLDPLKYAQDTMTTFDQLAVIELFAKSPSLLPPILSFSGIRKVSKFILLNPHIKG